MEIKEEALSLQYIAEDGYSFKFQRETSEVFSSTMIVKSISF